MTKWRSSRLDCGIFLGLTVPGCEAYPALSVDVENGVITIDLSETDPKFSAGDVLWLVPEVSEAGAISWHCESNIRTQWLPGNRQP